MATGSGSAYENLPLASTNATRNESPTGLGEWTNIRYDSLSRSNENPTVLRMRSDSKYENRKIQRKSAGTKTNTCTPLTNAATKKKKPMAKR